MKAVCVDLFKYAGNLLNAVLPVDISIGFAIIGNAEQLRTLSIKPKVLREVVAVSGKIPALYVEKSHVLSVVQPVYARILSAIIPKLFRRVGKRNRIDYIVSGRRDDSVFARLRANQRISISSEIAAISPLAGKYPFSPSIHISP